MPQSTVTVTSDNLFREINGAFQKTYRDVVGASANLASCMRLGVPSSRRKEYFGYLESPPKLSRLDRGQSVSEDGFRAISYNVENLTWAASVGYYEDDLEDLSLLDLRAHAQQLARRAAALPEQVFFQILTGAANASLLKAIPTSPDGAALFATSAGGSNRFGVSSGNLLTGNGVASSDAVRQDFWAGVQQAMQFQDTEGEPLLSEGVVDAGVTVVFGAGNLEAFTEGFKQTRTLDSAAVTNTILEGYSGNVRLWPTQRITDNDWFIFFGSESVQRPVFETMRQAPRLIDEDRSNSERARRQRIFSTILDMRAGYGINLPYGAVKINN